MTFAVIQSARHFWLSSTPAACQASLSFTISRSLLKPMFAESVMPPNHLMLLSPPPPALSLSQHQGLFQWVGSSHQVVKVLELQVQHQSFQWIFRIDFLYDWLVQSPWFLISRGLSRIFSSTTIQKHQLFSAQPSLWSNSQHSYMTTGKTIALTIKPLSRMWCLCFLICCLVLS